MKETKTTSVTLLSQTEYLKETIYLEWRASRTSGYLPTAAQVHREIHQKKHGGDWCGLDEPTFPEDRDTVDYLADVEETFQKVVAMKIPVAETIDFVFLLEHCPIALREQIVRHRIGHRFGGQLGADIIPDLSESTFWAQTMRVLDMGQFATQGEYLLPESVAGNEVPMPGQNKEADPDCKRCRGRGSMISQSEMPGGQHRLEDCFCKSTYKRPKTVEMFYREQMVWIQNAYNKLVKAGVPIEDARNILPLGCQHRLTWKLNLSSLMHIMSKRSCWIAQLGMWEPVITGMIEELVQKVDPFFHDLVSPPCTRGDEFTGCVFKLENENRVKQEDPYAPCPLYMFNHGTEAAAVALTVEGKPTPAWTLGDVPPGWEGPEVPVGEAVVAMGGKDDDDTEGWLQRTSQYQSLWGRNPFTGRKNP